ncbi:MULTISPECIES: hypothetical protein [Rhodococcus]|uniref:hypothetical protein n=1 Tax=Rhodococcus TaxID=1827 RepID=UPI0007AED123|nr:MULTISPECIES: hypothetical protein [Rhodococcus]KZL34994.1 hypothetical protein A3852_04325 [Rhodococcus qingshengii]MBQ9052462.1 hypothetical protein [Rhodococcus sp. (in: high G+C Gram-positive bacteria)]MCE4163340.1 hypothetical protein [Rhodococcus sp. Ni2]
MQQRSPVQIAQLYGPVASALVGGVVAAYAVAESRVDDFSFSDAGVISVVITPQWAGATAAVVAAVGVALLHRWGRGGLASVFAVVGALAIALPAFVPVSAQISVTLNAVGAGAFLAAAAFPTKGHRGAQTALGLGVTTTTLYFGAADLWRDRVPRWSLTLPGDSYPVPSTVPVWILLAATLLVGGVAALARPNQEPGDIDARLVKLGVVLPLVFTALYVWLGSTTSPGSWVIAVVLAVAVTVALAWRLPPHDGRFVLVGLAVSAVSVSSISFPSDWTWAMPAGAAALALGVVVGWRRPMPQLGLGLLAVTALSGLLDAAPTTVAYVLVLPLALGLAVTSCMPVAVGAVSSGSVFPFALTLFSVSATFLDPVSQEFGWSTDTLEEHGPVSVDTPIPLAVLAATATIVVAVTSIHLKRVRPAVVT